jgi:hypothetical protein
VNRFYIIHDDNSSSIVDSTTGQIVRTESAALSTDETFWIRDSRMSALASWSDYMNAQDFNSRRQFGESRAAFAART